jgi:hypothetical protein
MELNGLFSRESDRGSFAALSGLFHLMAGREVC